MAARKKSTKATVGGETISGRRDRPACSRPNKACPSPMTRNSLRAGERGPTLLEDFHFREKIFHFDHERIPERVVHARGYGAHGFFETYESLSDLTRADIFQRAGEAHARLRAFLGPWPAAKGRPTWRAMCAASRVKLYTKEGNWDIVGNNIPASSSRTRSSFPTSCGTTSPGTRGSGAATPDSDSSDIAQVPLRRCHRG